MMMMMMIIPVHPAPSTSLVRDHFPSPIPSMSPKDNSRKQAWQDNFICPFYLQGLYIELCPHTFFIVYFETVLSYPGWT